MCRELKTVGYQHIKAKMDNVEIPLGDLCCGSAWCAFKVGPVVDFIAPLEEVEEMWCAYQKAIDIIDRWHTFDDFYDVWNGRLGRHAGTWDKTIVFRGYTSRDYGITDKYPAFPVTDFIKLDREMLELHWKRASRRVEGLKWIHQMKDRIREAYRMRLHRRLREEEFDTNDCSNCNIRRRLG
jgi:hypothetical protein